MKFRARRPDRRRIKILRSYTIEEVARLLGVHRNTVRHWIKAGLPVIDSRRPALILGSDLAEFLAARRAARRHTCQPGQMYCVKCRQPREPTGRMADYVPSSPTAGALIGLCPACGTWINRRVSIARLPVVTGQLEVQMTQPQPRLVDTADPRVDCNSGHEV
jgi:excisionase family DNA binding protein